jgi:hypothetical protein
MQDPIFRKLAIELQQALPFPNGHEEANPRTAVFQLLFGAVMGLAEAKKLIDEAGDSLSARIHTPRLIDDLLEAHDDSSRWAATDSLRAWSIGYFIGKSVANISAALDRAVNIYIVRAYPAVQSLDEAVFFAPIPARMRFAESFSPHLKTFLTPLIEAFHSGPLHTEAAYQEILLRGHTWKYPPLFPEARESISPEEAIAVVIIWARNNAFKPQAKSYERFVPTDLTGEFVMAAVALNAMVKVSEALRT